MLLWITLPDNLMFKKAQCLKLNFLKINFKTFVDLEHSNKASAI